MNHKFLGCLLLIILFSFTFCISDAITSPPISRTPQILNITSHYSSNPPPFLLFEGVDLRSLVAGILSFVAAAISSAGGIGGGGLFIPILTVIAGLDVKTASTYSSFMVTGGSIANVATYMLSRNRAKRQIDYDVVLLCQPSLLLGVSCGVVLNVVFPSWLITVLFVGFVTFCTFKTRHLMLRCLQVTAVTCSFMVLMSSSMSALQFLLMGMKQIQSALTFGAICFVASLVGLTVIHQAISRYGRPSLIVFSVGTVMALSIVFMTSFGALDIWNSYISGEGMGFKKLC